MGEPEPEILDGEPTPLGRRRYDAEPAPSPSRGGPGRRLPRRQRAAIGLAVVLLGTGWLVDRQVGGHEASSVAACTTALRSVSREYDARIDAMYAYARPSLAGITGLMVGPARQLLPTARAAAIGCDAVRVLPWHSSNLAHRNADRAYGAALVARLVSLAHRQGGFRIDDPTLARLRAAAGIPPALGS